MYSHLARLEQLLSVSPLKKSLFVWAYHSDHIIMITSFFSPWSKTNEPNALKLDNLNHGQNLD